MHSRAASPAAGVGSRISCPSNRAGAERHGATSTIPAAATETEPAWNLRTQSSPFAIVTLAWSRAGIRPAERVDHLRGRAGGIEKRFGIRVASVVARQYFQPEIGPDRGGG